MDLKHVVETILATCLFWSYACSRPSDVVCQGGRSEGDKWFDGCRWCVCQRSGPLCSPAGCSELLSQLPPCRRIGSSWSDGCYHCKCHQHGIECTAYQECVKLMTNQRYRKDFLSARACVLSKDNPCICGIDGVPSCTAEVLDRNAYPTITVTLGANFPSSSTLLSLRNVNYDSLYRDLGTRQIRSRRPYYNRDLDYAYYENAPPDEADYKKRDEYYYRRHSLVKRHADQHSNLYHISPIPENIDTAIHSRNYINVLNDDNVNNDRVRKHLKNRLQQRNIFGTRRSRRNIWGNIEPSQEFRSIYNELLDRSSSPSSFVGQIREAPRPRYLNANDVLRSRDVEIGNEDAPSPRHLNTDNVFRLKDAEIRDKPRPGYLNKNEDFRWRDVDATPGRTEYLKDEAAGETELQSAPALVVVTSNRCSSGVRWYGGGLRCYCEGDKSITCGDPNFVASRIDGFRLESAPCEEGYMWEDEEACRICECPINGIILCRRSPSCPLPFLVKPSPLYLENEFYYDPIGFHGNREDPGGLTDHFTAERNNWNSALDSTDFTLTHNFLGNEITDNHNDLTGESDEEEMSGSAEKPDLTVDEVEENNRHFTNSPPDLEGTRSPYTNKFNHGEDSGTIKGEHGSLTTNMDTGTRDATTLSTLNRGAKGITVSNTPTLYDNVNFDVESTDQPNFVLEPQESTKRGHVTTMVSKGNQMGDSDMNKENGYDSSIDESHDKRTTTVIVKQCIPLSRWTDGCQRCKCDRDGRKSCDDSRCLKIGIVPMEKPNTHFQVMGDNRKRRPMQRPPSTIPIIRDTPISMEPLFDSETPCGPFKVDQIYYDECNRCICTPQGPKCTAKNCFSNIK